VPELHPVLPDLNSYIRAVQTGWLDDDKRKPATIIVRDWSFVESDKEEGGELISYHSGVFPVKVPHIQVRKGLPRLPVTVWAVVRQGRVVDLLTTPKQKVEYDARLYTGPIDTRSHIRLPLPVRYPELYKKRKPKPRPARPSGNLTRQYRESFKERGDVKTLTEFSLVQSKSTAR
jgi:hypothetical protein